jgi:lipopolysaccharide/colanic/teichoic acid biosynthesis glycosyltransferase
MPQDYTQNMFTPAVQPFRERLLKHKVDLFFKRFFDILIAVICIIILIIPYIITIFAVKLTSKGPAFFLQIRVGKDGKLFNIFKFRTMMINTGNNNTLTVGNDDPRITPIGNFLRTSRIDEFPQFFNVLKGDMSIIGVRPEIPHYFAYFKQEDYATLLIRPGMTSPASIKYRHENEMLKSSDDPEKKYIEIILPEKMGVNRDYIWNYSFKNDIIILGRTFKCLFQKDEDLERLR